MFAAGTLILVIWQAVDAGSCISPLTDYQDGVTHPVTENLLYRLITSNKVMIPLSVLQVVLIIVQVCSHQVF